MSLRKPKGSRFYHYEFWVDNVRYRRSSKRTNRADALAAMLKHREQVICRRNLTPLLQGPPRFSEAAQDFLDKKKNTRTANTHRFYRHNVARLVARFGSKRVTEITAEDVRQYQQATLRDELAPTSVNHDIGTLRAILRRHKAWEQLRDDVQMLPVTDEIGREINKEEEAQLLAACKKSRSRGLFTFVVILLCTGLRVDELKSALWQQFDLAGRIFLVRKSKTKNGRNRRVRLNNRALKALEKWASLFPNKQRDHYVFFTEKVTGPKKGETANRYYNQNPKKAMGSYKNAWKVARKAAKVSCRMHDLRHTAATRMLEKTKDLLVVARLLGWSPSTMYLMSIKYQHLLDEKFDLAVSALDEPTPEED